MNSVVLIGRLTRDPEVRYSAGTQMAICRFSVAIDRPPRQNGEKQTGGNSGQIADRKLYQ